MARGIGFGQYLDTESPIHALDARTKVVGALATMISLFCIHTPAQLILGLAFIIAVTLIARIGIKRALEATSYVLVMILILAVINLFLTTSGTPLVELGFIRITDDGVTAAVLYSLRLIIGVLAALVLLMTTTPARLTDAFDALLSPFGKIGLPAHSIAMVFSLMLRFIPTIGDEAAAIVEQHHDWDGDAMDEAAILYLADKCVREDRRVSIEERFAESARRCTTPEAVAAHARRRETAIRLRDQVNALCGRVLVE
jgi:hypothetical protein